MSDLLHTQKIKITVLEDGVNGFISITAGHPGEVWTMADRTYVAELVRETG